MKKVIFSFLLGLSIAWVGSVAAAAVLQGFQGGTGISTSSAPNVGLYLQVASTSPFLTYQFGNPAGGVTSLTGTAGQVNVSSSTGAITLSTPQNINTTSSPQFSGLTTTGIYNANGITNNGNVTTTNIVVNSVASTSELRSPSSTIGNGRFTNVSTTNLDATGYIKINGDAVSTSTGGSGVLTGTILQWTSSTAPTGYLFANGQSVSQSTFSGLYSVFGNAFTSTTNASTFTVPTLYNLIYNYNPNVATTSIWYVGNFNGGSSADSSGNSRPTVDANITYTSSSAGYAGTKAASFNGTNSKISLPSSTFSGDFTVAFAMNPATGTNLWVLGADQGSGSNPKWLFSYNGDTANAWAIRNSQSNQFAFGTNVGQPATSTWQHIAFTRSSNLFSLYMNGVLLATTSQAVSFDTPTASTTIGFAETNLFYTGLLDEFRIYDRALSQVEIQNLSSIFYSLIKT